MINFPTYRAKKIDSGEWVEGYYFNKLEDVTTHYIKAPDRNNRGLYDYGIDPKTLAINFKNMIDKNGKKIFASLSEDGVGGDIVQGKCRDCNGDELIGLHSPEPFKGIVRFYNETSNSVVIETTDRIAIGTENWHTPLILESGEALRWSDCRHDIEVVGIKETLV